MKKITLLIILFTTSLCLSQNLWTVNVQSGGYGDETSWTLRDASNTVILSGGPYGFGFNDTQTVSTCNEPLSFSIETFGTFNDNAPSWTISCGTNSYTGSIGGGSSTTRSNLICGPVINCVADAPRDTDMGVCTYTVVGAEFDATFTDNCMTPTITNDLTGTATIAGEVLPLGDTVVNWTVVDGNGQMATCATTITVEDNEAPVITCVTDAPRDTDMGVCNYTVVGAEFDATFTDNCMSMSATISNDFNMSATLDGAVLPLGANVITWTVNDGNGQMAMCTTTVTVEDNEAPVITCVADAPRDTDMGVCTYTVIGAEFDPMFSDNCMSATISNDFNMSATLDGAVLPLGANVITWTVDDGNGQMAMCTTTVTVEDNEAPVITCVADAPRDTDMGVCTYTVVGAEFDPMFSDNCMSATISNDFNMSATLDGAVLPLGANVITWTVDDGNGQTAMCTTTVTVSDNEAPVITCVADAPRDTDMGVCTYTIVGTEFDATFTDNCTTTTITNDLTGTATIAGEVLPLGDTVVTWTADDGNGQMAVCTTTITVEDNEAPSFMCVAPFVVMLDENGEASIDELDIIGGILTITSVSGNNGSGSSGTTDFTAPVLTDVTVTFDWAYSTTDGPFWDNFGYIVNGVYTQLSTSSGNPQSGSASVALLAGDVFGFRSSTVDNFAGASTTEVSNFTPGFTGQFAEDNWTLTLNNSDGTAFFNGTPNVTDNCGVASYSLDVYDFTCADLGDNLVTFTATDVNGNTTSCTTTVTVEDNLGVVVISGPVDIFTGTGPSDGDCETTINYGVIDINSFVIEDNCGDASTTTVVQTAGLGDGGSFPVGVTAEEFTLTDSNGNETIYIFNVTITDTTAPVVDCPGDLIVSDGGTGVYTIEDYTTTITDNCSSGADLVVTQDPVAGTEVANGSTTTVTVTATDASGNVTTCTFDILVDGTLGVDDTFFNAASISMYPNPTAGELNILAGNTTIDKVEVYDLAGRLVKRVSFDTTTYQFNLNDMDAAVYLVQIFSGSNTVVKRVIKK